MISRSSIPRYPVLRLKVNEAIVTKRAKVGVTFVCLFGASIALSAVHPLGNPHSDTQPGAPVLQGIDVPERVRSTLEAKCGDCHSQNTRYPLYSHLAPISWMIDRDVHEGRASLDMSRWQFYNIDDRINALTRMASEVHTGQMPPRTYVLLHPHARLSPEEQKLIYDWAKSERKHLRWALSHGPEQSSVDLGTQKP
jgi:Haem-binding domain